MKVLIIGSGPAAISAAETLRNLDDEAEIIMYSEESHLPYSPPAMVEYFLENRALHLWRDQQELDRLKIDLRTGQSITRVDVKSKTVTTADNKKESYDKLLVATGASLYAPLIGVEKPGIYNFKSLSAAEQLLKKVREKKAKTAVIVGSGFIGIEVALLLQSMGLEVTLLEQMDKVMFRMMDKETAEFIKKILQEKNIQLRLNIKAKAFYGKKQVEGVELENNELVSADVVVAATGVKPNTDFLADSGIKIDWGVVVDDYLATSQADVYAAGDVIKSRERLGSESYVNANFPNAVAQGEIAARNIIGEKLPYAGSERMHSLKHLGLPLIVAGKPEGEVLRLQKGNNVRKIFLKDNCIAGFHLINDSRCSGLLLSLMQRQIDVSNMKSLLVDSGFGMGYMVDWGLDMKDVG